MNKKQLSHEIVRILIIILCASFYAFFFKVIVEGRGFLSMGASGLALIIARLIGIAINRADLSAVLYMIINIVINIPIFLFGYNKISKKLILYSMIFVLVYSIVVGFVPENMGIILGFNQVDDLTGAILIGLISGISCAGTMMSGGSSGGFDIISTYLNVKRGRGIGTYKLIFNILILSIGLCVFKDVPAIIYTLVYAFVSSIILDRFYNRNKKILLEIVTTKEDEVCKYLLDNAHHGCTIFKAMGAYTKSDKTVIHTVISWFQLKDMLKAIRNIDDKCFIINSNVYNVDGEFYLPPIK